MKLDTTIEQKLSKTSVARLGRLMAEAAERGWTFIKEESLDLGWARYRHHCGHEQWAKKARMKDGRVVCAACDRAALTAKAKSFGWSVIEQLRAPFHSSLRHDACGTVRFAVKASDIRNGKALHCPVCAKAERRSMKLTGEEVGGAA